MRRPRPGAGQNGWVRVTAKVDYAVRAATMLATCAAEDAGPVKGERIATTQAIPVKYLENILSELRQAGIVDGQALRVLARYHRPAALDPHGRLAAEAIAEFELAPLGELVP